MTSVAQIPELEALPRLDAEQPHRIALQIRIETIDPAPEPGSEPALLIDRYHLEIEIDQRPYVLTMPLVELYRTRKLGRTYLAWEDLDQVIERGKSPLSLIRNEILDHRLLPRDPHHHTKVMAAIVDALDRVREATGLPDLARYQVWFVRERGPWTPLVLREESLEQTRQAAMAIGFAPERHIPTCITGIDAMEEPG